MAIVRIINPYGRVKSPVDIAQLEATGIGMLWLMLSVAAKRILICGVISMICWLTKFLAQLVLLYLLRALAAEYAFDGSLLCSAYRATNSTDNGNLI